MQNIPTGYIPQATPITPKKERGTFFTVVLLFQTVVALAATFFVVIGGAKVDRFTQGDSSWQEVHHVASRVVLAAAIFEIMKLVSLMGIWAWKRWALYLYFAASSLGVLAVYKLTGSISYWELAAIAFMVLGVVPRISLFED